MAHPAQESLVSRIRLVLADRDDVREVRMFGGLSFMVDERMAVAAGREGDLLVRVDPAQHDELLRRGGVPATMGEDRPMGRGWLTVPSARLEDDAELASWVDVGIDSRNAAG
jgi:TfoX/Sxy family transcriptional regulator of competence genes